MKMLTIQLNKKPIVPCTPLNTPITPVSVVMKVKYSVTTAIKKAGYIPLKRIDKTLQGCVWKVSKGGNIYVIKITNKSLHKKHVTKQDGEEIKISENIIKEKTILKYLSYYDPPSSLAKYIDFFIDKYNYFLVMQYAGKMSLFEFVKTCHQYIAEGILHIKEWQKLCKIAMKQMVDLLYWMHNKMHCSHMDVSLENFVIDNVMVIQDTKSDTISFSADFQIKIIDFGVAEVFCDMDFTSKKNVGKTQYKAPNLYAKRSFDARAADMWSLGVVFFIMLIGVPPFYKPSIKDAAFKMIMNGKLKELLIVWNKIKYVTPQILNLLCSLLQKEKYRLTIKDIKIHPFLL